MAEHPALMLWTDAYLGDAYHLSTEEHGAYFLLLIAAWRTPECRLPDNDKFLAKVVKATVKRWVERLRPTLEGFWDIADGFWTQKRLLKEREKARVICAKRSQAANEKWRRKALADNESSDAHASANGMQRARATPHPHPHTQKEKESRERLGRNVISSSHTEESSPAPLAGNGAKKGSRLSLDWQPDAEQIAYARRLDLDPKRTAVDFRDYWCAKPGKDGCKLNWPLTWQTWCRNAADRQARFRGGMGAASQPAKWEGIL